MSNSMTEVFAIDRLCFNMFPDRPFVDGEKGVIAMRVNASKLPGFLQVEIDFKENEDAEIVTEYYLAHPSSFIMQMKIVEVPDIAVARPQIVVPGKGVNG